MGLRFAAAFALAVAFFSGCSSVERYSDRSRRRIGYERQLAKARRGGTRAAVQSVFPSLQLTAPPGILGGMPWHEIECYRLDSDFLLVASFVYVDPRCIRAIRSSSKPQFRKNATETEDFPFGHPITEIHHSPGDFLAGSAIERIPRKR